jgi:hypothetical protein
MELEEYTKINSPFMRDDRGRFFEGVWAIPEFDYLSRNIWYFTEKVDGTNIRIHFHPTDVQPGKMFIGGRTKDAQIPPHLFSAIYQQFAPLEEAILSDFRGNPEEPPPMVTFYGEGYGPKINKGGGNYRKDPGFVMFDVKVGPWWLRRNSILDIGNKYGITVVPLVDTGTLYDMMTIVDNGLESMWGPFQAEGLIAKPVVELFSRSGERIITKYKAKDLKNGWSPLNYDDYLAAKEQADMAKLVDAGDLKSPA